MKTSASTTRSIIFPVVPGSDNVDDGSNSGTAGDGIPDSGLNVFDYSGLDFTTGGGVDGNNNDGTTGLSIAMFGAYSYEPGGSAGIGEAVQYGGRVNDQLWDVSALTGSVDNDTIDLYGGGYSYIDGSAGNDTMVFRGDSSVLKAGSYLGGDGDDTFTIQALSVSGNINGNAGSNTIGIAYDNNFTYTGTISNIGTLQLLGTAGDDTIDIAATTTTDIETELGLSVSSVNAGGGTDTLTLLANTANTYSLSYVENVTATGTGNDIITMTNASNALNVNLDGGTDTLNLYAGSNTGTFTNVENIVGTASNDTLSIDNALTSVSIDLAGGTDALTLGPGANTVTLSGVESVTGSAAIDTLTLGSTVSGVAFDMGASTDTINLYNGTNSGIFANTVVAMSGTTAQNVLTMGAAYSGRVYGVSTETDDALTLTGASNIVTVLDIESITSSTGNDALTLSNLMTTGSTINLGGGGVDTVALFDGTNTLSITNATSNTTINGTASDDALVLEAAFNGYGIIDLAGSSGSDTLTLANAVNQVTLSGIETTTGGTNDDYIQVALSELSNGISIDGNADVSNGDSLYITGGGTLTGANLAGVQSFEKWYMDTDAAYSITTNTANIWGAGADTLTVDASAVTSFGVTFDASAETDGGKLVYTGGSGADVVTGGAGVDVLTGSSGADTLNGGDSGDTYNISASAGDFTTGESIADTGASGTDVVSLSTAGAVDFSAGTLSGIENIQFVGTSTGNQLAMTSVQMNAVTSFTNLGGSNDQIILSTNGTMAFSGLDLTGLEAMVGSDLTGSGDVIQGTANADTISARAGADFITGNGGADILSGGSESDTFIYTTVTDSALGALDTILDFVAGGAGDKIDTNIIGTLAVIGDQSTGDTLANLNLTTLNALANFSNGTLSGGGTILSGGSTNTEVMQLTTSDSNIIWAIDVDGSGVFDASDSIIDVTGLTGTINIADFV